MLFSVQPAPVFTIRRQGERSGRFADQVHQIIWRGEHNEQNLAEVGGLSYIAMLWEFPPTSITEIAHHMASIN